MTCDWRAQNIGRHPKSYAKDERDGEAIKGACDDGEELMYGSE